MDTDNEETFEEEFISNQDIEEELEIGEQPEDDEEQMELNEDFKDNSVQGFFEHKEPVFCCSISPLHPMICASGGGNDASFLWSMETGEKIFNLGVHSDSCTAVKFSSDGIYVASGGMDGKIMVFQTDDGVLVSNLEGPSEVTWLDWHPRGHVLLVGSEDGTVWMFQIPSGKCMNVFSGHSESVTCGQFTPDGKFVVSGSSDNSIIVWDPKTGMPLHKWSGQDGRFHQAPITSLTCSKDSALILSGDQDGLVLLLQINSNKILSHLERHSESVESVQFSNNLPYTASAGVDGNVHVWNMTSNTKRYTVAHEEAVTKLRWSPDGNKLLTSSLDGLVKVWDARTGELMETLCGHTNSVLDFDIDFDGAYVVSGSDDGNCLVFSLS